MANRPNAPLGLKAVTGVPYSEQTNYQTFLPQTGFMRLPAILHLIPVGKTTWWSGVKSGRFPHPVKLGPRTTAWRVEDIRELIDQYPSGNNSQLTQPLAGGDNTRRASKHGRHNDGRE